MAHERFAYLLNLLSPLLPKLNLNLSRISIGIYLGRV
jgi:hypothetical protein